MINCGGISLDFKPYNRELALSDIDIENIDDADLSLTNQDRKEKLHFDKELLPDNVFFENCLIERKKQEKILKLILKRIQRFVGIENASIKNFVEGGYF